MPARNQRYTSTVTAKNQESRYENPQSALNSLVLGWAPNLCIVFLSKKLVRTAAPPFSFLLCVFQQVEPFVHLYCGTNEFNPQSRQSAKLFLQSSELRLPHSLTRRRVCTPHPLVPGGGTLACGRGSGGSQFERGNRHCGTVL